MMNEDKVDMEVKYIDISQYKLDDLLTLPRHYFVEQIYLVMTAKEKLLIKANSLKEVCNFIEKENEFHIEMDRFPLIILIEEAHYEQIDNDILTRDEGILALYRDEVLTCLEETLKRFMDFI
ncbi:hypothetical protein [Enterococcus cecorum]|uniref:Uncharacterized protein n=1 Tax=Enterococcus cecorum DSM 20682 = ATCC 43198 TaxID=1121864 RepID=S1R8M4_9ENTE|nr:hypothetical protein [Enterococcus cecorum]HIT44039.1 hypothetical protein [Candidatus Avacholeplasma faecigallinarum]EOX19194.1 hypothetical protein I567_00949 [Enterococcus cecorum DSM 20682 = ATCC 43198]ESK61077.1 hypothetical protein OMO_01136 [Enterococcus cecorum DSM 20682 = ATCC 43198]KLN92045.1 hypothetical protein ABT60_10210 [Enterococcus cecorum]KLN93045.1 hypothetical protein ABT59_05925 [Enterococcus cecorum]